MKDFILVGAKANLDNFLCLIEAMDINYIVIETDYTVNHFEIVLASCRDRGCFKWIAETKKSAYIDGMKDERARLAHIDYSDCFPRFYFYADSLINEFSRWCAIRKQDIQLIKVPVDFSPNFNWKFYTEIMKDILGSSK